MRLMSSRDLDNKISQSLLFLHDPVQPFALKVFGSTHIVTIFLVLLLINYMLGQNYVLLGWTSSQKKYKCFHILLITILFEQMSPLVSVLLLLLLIDPIKSIDILTWSDRDTVEAGKNLKYIEDSVKVTSTKIMVKSRREAYVFSEI